MCAGKSVKERDEIVNQEARKLVIAELQNILPMVLGRTTYDLDFGSAHIEKLDPPS